VVLLGIEPAAFVVEHLARRHLGILAERFAEQQGRVGLEADRRVGLAAGLGRRRREQQPESAEQSASRPVPSLAIGTPVYGPDSPRDERGG
jgi:hypothetical protein